MSLRVATTREFFDVKLYSLDVRPGEWMGFRLRVDADTVLTYELVFNEDGTYELHGTKPIPFKSWEEIEEEERARREHNSKDV